MDSLGTPVTIDIDRVFAEINSERKAAALPQIEHAVMRVRLNIRLAIKRVERLPDEGPITVAPEVLKDIAWGLNELFQTGYTPERLQEFSQEASEAGPVEESPVEPSPISEATSTDSTPTDSTPSTPSTESTATSRIYLVDFFAAINQSRRDRGLPPIEPAVISVRTGVRFSILRKWRLDFGQAYFDLNGADLAALTDILTEQFDIALPDGLHGLIVAGRQRQQDKPRKQSWLERMFRKRSFDISVPSMIMAVTRQRAKLGYRPMSPAQINEGCGNRLAALGIRVTPNTPNITLNEQQMDRLAEFLREEYGLYFEDLESFIKTGH